MKIPVRPALKFTVYMCVYGKLNRDEQVDILLRFISGNSSFYNIIVRLVTSKCTAVYTGPLVSVCGVFLGFAGNLRVPGYIVIIFPDTKSNPRLQSALVNDSD